MPRTAAPLGPLAGVGFAVLAIAGTVVYPPQLDFAADPANVAALYREDEAAIVTADVLYLLGAVLLLVFAAAIRTLGRRAEGGDGAISAIAFAGGVAGSALALAAASLDAMAALRVSETGTIDPLVATALYDGSMILFGLAAAMAFGVFVLGVAVLSLRHGLLPRWHGALSAVLGIALLVPPVSHAAVTIGLTMWALLTGLLLALGQRSRRENARVATAPTATRYTTA